jgi:surface antigen
LLAGDPTKEIGFSAKDPRPKGKNNMRSIHIVVLAGALVFPVQSAEAQLLFGSRLGEAHYQGDDTKIISQIGADMLRNAPDGETCSWSNPQTGHHGDITVIRSYRMKDMPCRDTRVNGVLGTSSISYVLPVCQIGDGTWKVAVR